MFFTRKESQSQHTSLTQAFLTAYSILALYCSTKTTGTAVCATDTINIQQQFNRDERLQLSKVSCSPLPSSPAHATSEITDLSFYALLTNPSSDVLTSSAKKSL
jgi:peroxiredoxin